MTLIFFLDFRKLKDGFHRSIDSDRTAVQAKVIASGVTPFLIGIVIIITGTLFICLNHNFFRLICCQIIILLNPLNFIRLISADKN